MDHWIRCVNVAARKKVTTLQKKEVNLILLPNSNCFGEAPGTRRGKDYKVREEEIAVASWSVSGQRPKELRLVKVPTVSSKATAPVQLAVTRHYYYLELGLTAT